MMPYGGYGCATGYCGANSGGRMYGGSDVIGVQNMYGEQMSGGFNPAAIGAYGAGPNDGGAGGYMDYGGTLPPGPGQSFGGEFGYGGPGGPSGSFPEYPPAFGGATIGAPETCTGTETALPNGLQSGLPSGFNGYTQDDMNRLIGGNPSSYDFEQHRRPPPMPGQKSIPSYYLHYESGTLVPMHIM